MLLLDRGRGQGLLDAGRSRLLRDDGSSDGLVDVNGSGRLLFASRATCGGGGLLPIIDGGSDFGLFGQMVTASFEATAGSVIDGLDNAGLVQVAVFTANVAVLVAGLYLKRTISRLVAIRVGSIVVHTIDLLQDGNGR